MSQPASQIPHFPNRLARDYLCALEEVIGEEALHSLFHTTGLPYSSDNLPPKDMQRQVSFADISRLEAALDELYGEQCGRGVSLRSGRAFFNNMLRDFTAILGLNDTTYRTQPLPHKIKNGLNNLATFFNQHSGQDIRVEVGDNITWINPGCPLCWQRTANKPICHTTVGFLQEAMFWISGGKNYAIDEIECIANGHAACVLQIKPGG